MKPFKASSKFAFFIALLFCVSCKKEAGSPLSTGPTDFPTGRYFAGLKWEESIEDSGVVLKLPSQPQTNFIKTVNIKRRNCIGFDGTPPCSDYWSQVPKEGGSKFFYRVEGDIVSIHMADVPFDSYYQTKKEAVFVTFSP